MKIFMYAYTKSRLLTLCNVLQALSLLDGLRSTGLHSRVELCLQDQLVRSGVGR
jgi:hypothetical protein